MATKEDSDMDMEGWEDDGWGTFDSTPQRDTATSNPAQEMSSGADFFDNFGAGSNSDRTKTTATSDPFEEFGFSSGRSQVKKERTPPPLTSASLFGASTGGMSASAERNVSSGGGGDEGWEDWGESFGTKPVPKVCSA